MMTLSGILRENKALALWPCKTATAAEEEEEDKEEKEDEK